MADVSKNQFLKVAPGVKLNPTLEACIVKLESYFKKANLQARVTSGIRTKDDQLRIIRTYAKRYKIQDTNLETCLPDDKLPNGQYKWQEGWSKLLAAGVIINPPLPAAPLYDYIRNGKNLKGKTIQPSPHFRGTAIDIGGGSNGILDELSVLNKAWKDGVFRNLLAERNNNAIHIDV